MENVADTLMWEIITGWFQSTEDKIFFVQLFLSLNYFDISTPHYIRESAQVQWQNYILVRPISVADRFNVLVCVGLFRRIAGLNPDMRVEFPFFFYCVMCISSGLCLLCVELIVVFLPCVRVCNCVCGLGTSTNSHTSPQFAATPHKITQTLLTDTGIAVGVFLQLLDSATVSVVWTFL